MLHSLTAAGLKAAHSPDSPAGAKQEVQFKQTGPHPSCRDSHGFMENTGDRECAMEALHTSRVEMKC